MDRSKWEYKKLGEVCNLYQPKTISSDMLIPDGKYLVYGANGVIGKYNEYNHENSEVLMTCRGATCGTINVSAPYSWINGNAMVVHPRINDLSAQFLVYQLKAADKTSVITGAAQPQITRQMLQTLPFVVAPLADQQRIVAELDCLNEMIAVKQEQLKEFDKLAQSIFYDMFGRGTSQQQWDQTTIGDIAEEIKYGTSSPATPNGKYKYLRMNNMTNDGYLDLSDLKYIDVDESNYEKYVVRKGDVLFNRTNSRELVGKTALFDFEEEMIIAGYIIRVRLKALANPCFVVRYMNLPEQKDYLRGLCRGAIGQANINAKELQAIPIPLPPLSLQQEFAEKISAIEAQKELVKQSIAETQHLLDYTMDKYFG